ncbi:hypothetical protein [Streptomyces sp. NPDC007369]|uniref:hypothetical protein n=1 Tax=Streptomyces sp. NPDC007369 TaxID=3154589 RepID=UPI0033FC9FAA
MAGTDHQEQRNAAEEEYGAADHTRIRDRRGCCPNCSSTATRTTGRHVPGQRGEHGEQDEHERHG